MEKIKKEYGNLKKLNKVHWLVLCFSVLLTIFAWRMTLSQMREKNFIRFDREANQVVNLITERMNKYEEALVAGVAAIQIYKGELNSQVWKNYTDSFKIDKRYPGINGIGVIYKVDKKNLVSFVTKQKVEIPDFKIYPEHSNPDSFPITYIEPIEDNLKARGLDIAHEKNRYEAALIAEKTGKSQITAPIILVQDSKRTPGFLLYAPFYKDSLNNTEALRRENIIGFVYAPFVVKKLMNGALADSNRSVSVNIDDAGEDLYNETDSSTYIDDPAFSNIIQKNLFGRTWNFAIQTNSRFNESSFFTQPNVILFGGILIDLLVLLIFISQARTNSMALSYAEVMSKDISEKAQALEIANRKMRQENEERQNAERKITDALKAKSIFLANMSHEIRTPLNGIIGLTQLIDIKKLDTEIANDITQIRESSLSLLQIVNDVLDISKLNEGRIQIDSHPFNLEEVLRTVLSLFKANLAQQDIALELNIEPELPKNYLGDPYRLRQIVMNLVGNALKFTHKGKIEVNVKFVQHSHDDNIVLQCDVKDTGIGIEPEALDRLFQPFEQADKGISREFGGTGLGLSISKGLVELMNGEIWVTSEVDVGSVFSFTFVVKKIEGEITKVNNEETKVQDVNFEYVLLVEDNKVNQVVAKRLLEKAGIGHVDIAANGEEALSLIKENVYQIIFMDVQMPVMDGITATKKIREFNRDVYIIGLSANAFLEDQENAIKVGMNDYIAKPIHYNTLLERIKKIKL